MSNVRISGLPINLPTPSSYLPVEVMTSPGVFTTSKTQLSTFTQAGPDFKHFQSSFSTATALSAGWQTAYINLCAYAPSWIGNNTVTSANSSRWSSAYNTVTAYFPFWQAGYNFSIGNGASVVSTVSSNSASWGGGQSVYTTVNANSAAWQTAGTGGGVSVYNTVNPLSAAWTSATKTVTALSSHWEGVFTNVYPNSGNWQSTYTLINTTTATTFLVNGLSAYGNIATTGNITTTGSITGTGNIVSLSPILGTSPNVGTTGGIIVKDAVGNPNTAYLQFTNNADTIQYGYVQGLSAGGINISGNVGINTTTPNQALTVQGSISATGSILSPTTCKAWINFNGGVAAITSMTSISFSGTLIQAQFSSAHGLNQGDQFSIFGATGNSTVLNGGWKVNQVVSSTNFTFIINSTPPGTLSTAYIYPMPVRSSYNISNTVKLGIGQYAVYFTAPLSNNGYSLNGTSRYNSGTTGWLLFEDARIGTRSASVVYIATTDGTTYRDSDMINIQIFGS